MHTNKGLSMHIRPDFDFTAECGVWQCEDCWRVWYPMELDNDNPERLLGDWCPECSGHCNRLSSVGIASVQLMWTVQNEI